MNPDSALLTVMIREANRIAELEAVLAERDQTISELRAALDNAASSSA